MLNDIKESEAAAVFYNKQRNTLEVIKDLFLDRWQANIPAVLEQCFSARAMQENQLPTAAVSFLWWGNPVGSLVNGCWMGSWC